jgi:hypothetical protein
MKRSMSYRLVVFTFCAAVALSAVLLVPATINYLEFYVALGHMYLRINSFDIYTVLVGGEFRDAMVSANLSIIQDSSYVGLKVQTVDIIVYYDKQEGYSSVLFSRKFPVDVSIGPHSSVDLIMANETYLQYFPLFADYNNQSMARGEPVKLRFSTDVNLFMLGNPLSNALYLGDVTYQMPYYVT